MTSTHTTPVSGGTLHYEIRGSGPVLIITGAPMGAAAFAPLADALSTDHTVVTHDPRGVGGSVLHDPGRDSTPELRADDLLSILDSLQAEDADVFGSSGGAVTGLALITRHADRVRTLVAHEPPLLELLPYAADWREKTESIIETAREHGVGAGWGAFMRSAGFDTGNAPPPPETTPTPQEIADSVHFFEHELRGTTRYVPDFESLKPHVGRIVVGLGEDSGHLNTDATTRALAALLDVEPVLFPGDHAGFIGQPAEFAARLRAVLATD
ncbi:pimeloyl-ACP methyl ester carboxylesterase [Conyzicola lurida]|uniref:Pimeloyl-ACP methyl ester carboxylesterase n=1 Tax=Conyzicola lurida TaxID=1172621 RepID=A0A841ATG4_9MICO|nr:alpha/beta hydrolase [Conyzicola lurida]MBB5844689.1 pimeloyl-ACP methyl ester carboxylesterase [Conyzicola lurida]